VTDSVEIDGLEIDGLETRRWNRTKSVFADYAAAPLCSPTGNARAVTARQAAGNPMPAPPTLSRYGRGFAL
jgi:hypothetical protein